MITGNAWTGDMAESLQGAIQAAYRGGPLPCFAECEQAPYYFMRPPANKGLNVRADFPVLSRTVNGFPLVWLDNGATTQKPQCVIDAVSRYYREINSNVHRGAHTMAREATQAYEDAREKVASFIGAERPEELVFVRGATEAINLAAWSWGNANLKPGDEILVTQMEHHSNIVPWQMLAQRTGAVLKAAPINVRGEIDLFEYGRCFTPRTRMAAAAHVSNVLGTVNPIREMAEIAHAHGAVFLADGAQSVPHMPVDVRALGVDFFAFSGHKLYAPMGIGALYGRLPLLEAMEPYQGGGGMIDSVRIEGSTYQNPPARFEAGTGSIADAVGLGAATDYLSAIGMRRVEQHERELTARLLSGLSRIPGLRILGSARDRISVVSFVMDSTSPERIAEYLDRRGIEIRAGHHCSQPVHAAFGITKSARASIGIYNTEEDIDELIRRVSELA